MTSVRNKLLQSNKQTRICIILLCTVAILVNIKSIFTDFDVDSEYALAMSYRMLRGDKMFTQMWEPHQTSAFLTTFLMQLYLAFTKTTTGIVLFLHCMGVLLQGGLSIILYKVLVRWLEPFLVFFMCIFFFAVRAKGIVFPEFSNMQIWFSVLLFLCLLLYFETWKKGYLVGASICLCLQILSYPSCLIVFFLVMILLLSYSNDKWKDIILFSILCFLQGMCYILFFVTRMGCADFIVNIRNIVGADSSHGTGAVNRQSYFFFLNKGCIWLIGCLGITLLVWLFLRFILHKNPGSKIILVLGTVIMLSEVVVIRDRVTYSIVYFLIIFGGMKGIKYCGDWEKKIYVTGLLISTGSFLATILLTNLEILSVAAYLILGVMVSFLPVSRWADKNIDYSDMLLKQCLLPFFCIMILLQRGIMTKSMDISVYDNIFNIRGVVLRGPALGIMSDYMGVYETKCNIEDWEKYVYFQDKLLIVGEDKVGVMSYLYRDVTISVHSTICTPTYDENLLEYWQQNPEKEPNVVAMSCWYGDLHVGEDNWIFQWMKDKFGEVVYEDGRYWRFYRAAE